jgi:hypothetical protein
MKQIATASTPLLYLFDYAFQFIRVYLPGYFAGVACFFIDGESEIAGIKGS